MSSYSRKFKIKNAMQLGYIQQYKIYNLVKKYQEPVIINSEDIINNPEMLLSKLCQKLKIKFERSMLSWPSGPRKTDGIWGSHWYKNVINSTGFVNTKRKKIEIPDSLKDIYLECMEYYTSLKNFSLKF